MTNWPVGLSTGCFYHQSILECLPMIRESGFSMIEVCSSPQHLDFHDQKNLGRAAEAIQKLGMEAYSFHAPFAPRIDIASSDAKQRKDSVTEILKAAEAAALLGVHYFILHPGPENPAPVGTQEQLPRMQHLIESLNEITARCYELGIRCALENKLPHLLFGNASDILWILDGITTEGVGACLDTGHAFLGGDLRNLVHKLASRLKIVHAHDNGGAGDNHLPPGDGRIDWKQFFGDLIGIRFHGALILELAGQANSAVTLANARRGRAFLRKTARSFALQIN